MSKPTALIIGAGPAGLMAAETLATADFAVEVHDRMPSPARKFLMAGRGGLNLTHSEPFERFIARYGRRATALRPALEGFTPADLRRWADAMGAQTFVGSSGRVFPKAMKASPLLRAWLARLSDLGVTLHARSQWQGWDADGRVLIDGAPVASDVTVLALGGASWPRLGADGGWVPLLGARGVEVAPLQPANAGFQVAWSPHFADKFAGEPLKNIALRIQGREGVKEARGELMLTRYGIEGGAVYALSAALRDAITRDGCATLEVDLRPDLTAEQALNKLKRASPKDSRANQLRKALNLSPAAIALLREGIAGTTCVNLRLTAMQGLERAISTAGGVRFDGVNADFELKAMPGVYVIGEMLDWEAPTGGYLLQACFSTAVHAARAIQSRLSNATPKG